MSLQLHIYSCRLIIDILLQKFLSKVKRSEGQKCLDNFAIQELIVIFAFNMTEVLTQKIYIIAGCNGAGKTTASFTILPQILECDEFVNADEIARGLSPFHPERVSIEAGRLMLERIAELMKARTTFALETTLSTRSYVSLIDKAHKAGYTVELLFFWLSSPEIAIQRVAKRVSEGGHNIPEEVILRRYDAGIKNLFNIYSHVVDRWMIVDNNSGRSVVLAESNSGITKIYDFDRFKRIMDYGHDGK